MDYVLITGASTGIGLELAKIFAKNNHALVLVSSSEKKLLAAKKEIEQEYDVPIIIYSIDLGLLDSAKTLYEYIKQQNIFISVLINNAGFGLVGATEKIDFAKDEKMMILNNISLVNLTKYFIMDMYEKKKGMILNVASIAAFQPGPYSSTYFASKSFVLSYSQAIRYEAKSKGIVVSVLCPGATKTNFFSQEGVDTPTNAMSAQKVALYTYKQMLKGKEIIIPGLSNKIKQFLPIKFKMKVVANMKKQ